MTVVLAYHDPVLVCPDEHPSSREWMVGIHPIDRNQEIVPNGSIFLFPGEARERAEWIRATKDPQPGRVREAWFAEADRLDFVAGQVDRIRAGLDRRVSSSQG